MTKLAPKGPTQRASHRGRGPPRTNSAGRGQAMAVGLLFSGSQGRKNCTGGPKDTDTVCVHMTQDVPTSRPH